MFVCIKFGVFAISHIIEHFKFANYELISMHLYSYKINFALKIYQPILRFKSISQIFTNKVSANIFVFYLQFNTLQSFIEKLNCFYVVVYLIFFQVESFCSRIENHLFEVYKVQNKEMQDRIQRILETLDRISKLETELQEFRNVLNNLYKEIMSSQTAQI